MGEGHAQQADKVWKFSHSDITSEFLNQKYGITLSFICLSRFGATYILFCLFGGTSEENWERTVPDSGQDLKIFYLWYNMFVFDPKIW